MACPAVYGDPALLTPLVFPRRRPERRSFRLGLVPHYTDARDPQLAGMRARDDVRVIDVLSGIESVIEGILDCDSVLSTSLHGLIVAHAYGVPARWIRISDRVQGGNFKFEDYLLSVGHPVEPLPLATLEANDLDTVVAEIPARALDIDIEPLIESCPFRARPTASYLASAEPPIHRPGSLMRKSS
jgi:pyruvyltransferase